MTLFGIEKNWWHNVDRCLRTIKEILGNDMEWPERHGTYHNALDDAVYQAKTISLNLNKTVYND